MRCAPIAAIFGLWLSTASGLAQESPAEEGAALTPARLRQALARYAHEPSPAQLVAAALEADARDPAAIRRAMARARRRGWIPRVRMRARRGLGRDLSLRDGDESTNVSTDDDLSISATLTFDLGRVLFAKEEVSLAREVRQRSSDRVELTERVVHLYFERRRLQLERDLLGRHDATTVVRIAEIEALLDVFTDGVFRRMLDESAPDAP